jgi:FKBP-type peptidyl-prolyl cis-trans isomerase
MMRWRTQIETRRNFNPTRTSSSFISIANMDDYRALARRRHEAAMQQASALAVDTSSDEALARQLAEAEMHAYRQHSAQESEDEALARLLQEEENRSGNGNAPAQEPAREAGSRGAQSDHGVDPDIDLADDHVDEHHVGTPLAPHFNLQF